MSSADPLRGLPQALRPEWPAPAGVQALMSTRHGGVSPAPFDSLNLRLAPPQSLPGDDAPEHGAENRRRFAAALGATPVWLHQVHGCTVLRLTRQAATAQHVGNRFGGPVTHRVAGGHPTIADGGPAKGLDTAPPADAAITTERGLACAVQVADCLPVLLCSRHGDVVGAAHAGWRGLAAGVLEATVQAMTGAADCRPEDLIAWLGPCIGPAAFEVGAEVLTAFGQLPEAHDMPGFRRSPRADGSPRWRADLPALARSRLQAIGVGQVSGGHWCTYSDADRFFSYRRAPRTGRQAAAVALV